MTVLEQITQMKNQGIPDEEIVNTLQQQGISPKEINDTLSQARIKSAISDSQNTEAMQPSIMQGPNPPVPGQQSQGIYTPQTQEMPEQGTYTPQEYPQSQEFYQQDAYGDYPSGGIDTESIIEVAEQVFSEKIKKTQKQVDEGVEFKTLAETKIDNISKRLRRIETTIDQLQISILEKVGSYGKNLENIKKEMSMMQDSFGKVVNQAVRGHKVHAAVHKTPIHKKPTTTKKTSKKKK